MEMDPNFVFAVAKERGRKRHAALKERLADRTIRDVDCLSLEDGYLPMLSEQTPSYMPELTSGMQNEGISETGWDFLVVECGEGGNQPYSNHFQPSNGVIACHFANKFLDSNSPEMRLERSDVLFRSWELACSKRHMSMGKLRLIWQVNITNFDTLAIIGEARNADSMGTGSQGYAEYSPDHEMFSALAGGPNGGGILRMLTDHAGALRYKEVRCVRIYEGDGRLSLCWVLQNVASPGPKKKIPRSRGGFKGKSKKHSH
ncbi:hypothetical protein DL95DRAFT_484785 [Leptodontidium sp. 2 PMI_412]|nr:hypothetical protein DL95DRAFT_484785 [Leptodontidium sp. 2 PMI_412]